MLRWLRVISRGAYGSRSTFEDSKQQRQAGHDELFGDGQELSLAELFVLLRSIGPVNNVEVIERERRGRGAVWTR